MSQMLIKSWPDKEVAEKCNQKTNFYSKQNFIDCIIAIVRALNGKEYDHHDGKQSC